jgi:hypothetical protein
MNPLLEIKLIRLDRPPIRYTGRGTQHYSHLEAANEEAAFWQSKATTNNRAAPFPQLVSLPQLARDIRRTWP